MRRTRTDQGGFTMVEALFAAFFLAAFVLAILTVFDKAGAGVNTSERELEANAAASAALEQLMSRPYSQLSNCLINGEIPMNTSGTPTIDDPSFWVSPGSSGRLHVKQDYKSADGGDAAGTPSIGEPFVTNSSGDCAEGPTTDGTGVIAGPIPVTSQTGSRLNRWKLYRFVTWYDDRCGGSLGTDPSTLGGQADGLISGLLGTLNTALQPLYGNAETARRNLIAAFCGSTTDAKRITVAIVAPRLANGAGPRLPVYLTAIVPDPNAGTAINAS